MADTTEDKSAKGKKSKAATETDENRTPEESVGEATDATLEGTVPTESDAAVEGTVAAEGSQAEVDGDAALAGTVETTSDAAIAGTDPSKDEQVEETQTSGPDGAGPEEPAGSTGPVASPSVPALVETEKKSGFVPMLLGGVIAAGLGYGAAVMGFAGGGENPFEAETRTALSEQGARLDGLAALNEQVTEVQQKVSGIDLAALENGLAGVQDGLSEMDGKLTGLGDQIAALESRMTALEKQPLAEAVSPEAIAAYERELEALRSAVSEQQAALEAEKAALSQQLDQKTAEMQQIVEEARALETSAEDQARLAAARAALADVTARVQEGQPFAEPLAIVAENGVTVTDALSATADEGVPTVAALAASFPDAARDALAASRKAQSPEGEASGGGLGAFFQSQLGARSVTPQEGSSTDAILSRAEAAVRNGELATALTELEALPAEAKAAMDAWIARANQRSDALAEASALAQQLNQQ
ncbi:COG4223 family protein [Sagittula sp. S175]|uniref:COG4223 family protein n=1 Tax=Sagittula sp. S175 TaxID=3415129 RepID=UPI003C7B4BF1